MSSVAGPSSSTAASIVSHYVVRKLGHTGSTKQRTLVIRSDLIAFLESPAAVPAQMVATTPESSWLMTTRIKRIIPFSCVHSMTSYEGGKQLHLLIRNQHDAFFWKDDVAGGLVDDIINLILKLSRQCGNPVNFVRESGPVDPDDMTLDKSTLTTPYTSIQRRCDLRRSKSKTAIPPGPITLQTWDAIGSPLPFALDPSKMSAPLQRAFQGMHIVMLGAVMVHQPSHLLGPNNQPVSRVLAFTPSRFVVCDEESGRELVTCCLFSLSRIVVNNELRSVSLHVSDELISVMTFAFPSDAKNAGAHVSDDVGVVSNVIRFLLARDGVDVAISRASSGPTATAPTASNGNLSSEGAGAQLDNRTTTVSVSTASAASVSTPVSPHSPPKQAPLSPARSASSAASAAAVSSVTQALALVPDYKKPHGPIAQKFKSAHVVHARPVLRLTSKGAWEPRVWVVTTQERLLICDEKMNVKRSIHLDHIDDICTVEHWEGQALALKIQDEHDLVVKLHPDAPKEFTIAHMVTVLVSELKNNASFHEVVPRKDQLETKDRLRDVLLRERPMKKGTTFVSPAQEVARKTSQSPSRIANGSMDSSVSPRRDNSTRAPSTASEPGTTTLSRAASMPQAEVAVAAVPATAETAVSTASPKLAEQELKRQLAATSALKSLTDRETHQREVMETFERQGILEALSLLADDERRSQEAEKRRLDREKETQSSRQAEMRARLQAEEETRRQREIQESMIKSSRHMLLEMESKYRVDIESSASEGLLRTQREELHTRQWLMEAHAKRAAAAPGPGVDRARLSLLAANTSHTTDDGTAPPSPTSDAGIDIMRAPSALTSEGSIVQGGFVSRSSSRALNRDGAAEGNSPLGITSSFAAAPDLQPRAADDMARHSATRAPLPSTPSRLVTVHKEVSLFSPIANSTSNSLTPLTYNNVNLLNSSNTIATPYPRPAAAVAQSNRLITFPTPTSQAVPPRGSDGSKNCFFRIKIGTNDAMAIVGNEKFAVALLEQLKGSVNSTLSSSGSVAPFLRERVVCVATDEPRVGSGDLFALIEALRTSSLRSWIRRDMVMIRSSNFLWVEFGVIPFLVALERGEKASHIADKLLAGGASGLMAPTGK